MSNEDGEAAEGKAMHRGIEVHPNGVDRAFNCADVVVSSDGVEVNRSVGVADAVEFVAIVDVKMGIMWFAKLA